MLSLQFITHQDGRVSYAEGARMALEGGCRWVQFRMKGAARQDDDKEALARQIQRLCQRRGATFIIDDDVELAKRIGADGVHLGRNDMPIARAREYLGGAFVIGGTANTIGDIRRIHREGADYIGCGPFRFTTTKERLSPVLGLDGYRALVRQMRSEGIGIPLVAIGGITPGDIPGILAAGVDGIALSGTVLRAERPIEQTQNIIRILQEHEQ